MKMARIGHFCRNRRIGFKVLKFFWVRIGFEEFLYKGNDEVSKELLSKNFQNPCFCFGYKLSYSHPN